MESSTHTFTRKIFIRGEIEVLTGLHVGGSKADLEIGGIDLNVVKTADNKRVPFIPGSSLKGKLRTLLARETGSKRVKDDAQEVLEIFGFPAEMQKKQELPTRLIVRDAFLQYESFKDDFNRENLDTEYTEVKWENTIDRKTGTAQHPRQIERVPALAKFEFEMIYNSYSDGKEAQHIKALIRALRMLEDDYLGGHGSRGYGRIAFQNVSFTKKAKEEYEGENTAVELTEYSF